MKCSTLQMIAIVCILAVGLFTVTPFLSKVSADPSEVTHTRDVTVMVCVWHGPYYEYTTSESTTASGWHEGDHWSGSNSVPRHDVSVDYNDNTTYVITGDCMAA